MELITLQTQSVADNNILINLASRNKRLIVRQENDTSILLCGIKQDLDHFMAYSPVPVFAIPSKPIKNYQNSIANYIITPHTTIIPRTARSWFYANEVASIYNFPTPSPTAKPVIGIVSFGGGLFGSIDSNGVVTNGDCQAYWTLCGISSSDFPTVVVKPLFGTTNDITDDESTGENTLDVEMAGASCPTANTTIILYIVPNSINNFATVINYMLTTPVTVNEIAIKPTVISISWGLPEVYMGTTSLNTANTAFASAVAQGVSISVATGDNGANDGVGGRGKYTDFPSSSPNVIACGGTRLVCPNYVYDNATTEYAWPAGGGGISQKFTKPAYQRMLSGTYRQTPDIASVADPNTGVLFIVDGKHIVYGGTSVSAPTITGFLASINCRVWANPLFYSTSLSNFNDILTGNNGGYYAATGYDNCTGLGSPKGNLLKPLFGIHVTSVIVDTSAITLETGKTFQINLTILPSNAENKAISWSSLNSSIATVNSSGLITGIASGTTNVRVITQDGNKQASIRVIVRQSATGISLLPTSLTVRRGRTATIRAIFAPSNTYNKNLTWMSANTSAVTVNNGNVTGKTQGTTTITATSADGGFTATCDVTVL